MLIWLVKDGETMPIQAGTRAMRTGMLADELAARDHTVVWWSSTFSHQFKRLLHDGDLDVAVKPGLTLRLLHSGSYRRNISLERRRHHRLLAARFRERALESTPPDVIVSAFPIIDLAYEVVRYGASQNVPVIVDVRDLWPDTLVEKAPRLLRPPVRVALAHEYRRTSHALQGADGLVAISNGCLQWGLGLAGRPAHDDDGVFYTSYPDSPSGDDKASPGLRDLSRSLKDKVVFTFVGTFGHSYQLNLICEVASRAWSANLDQAMFVLAGSGQQLEAVKRKAASLPNLAVTGWLDADDVSFLLRRSDVGLLPCDHVRDAMPNKAFAYMLFGLPILSSLVGEFEHLLAEEEFGFSYNCGDAGQLLLHVEKLTHESALRGRLAAHSRSVFIRRFQAGAIYSAYADHVERIATKGRTRNGGGPSRDR